MVRRDGYVKVLDFALAKFAEPKGSSTDKVWHYYFQKDREHFAATRAISKAILGGYLNVTAPLVASELKTFNATERRPMYRLDPSRGTVVMG